MKQEFESTRIAGIARWLTAKQAGEDDATTFMVGMTTMGNLFLRHPEYAKFVMDEINAAASSDDGDRRPSASFVIDRISEAIVEQWPIETHSDTP